MLELLERQAGATAEFQKRVLEQLAYQSSILHEIATTLKAMEAAPNS